MGFSSNANPVEFAGNALRLGFATDSTYADHRIERAFSNAPHAVLGSKPPFVVRIAYVGSLIDECAHMPFYAPARETSIGIACQANIIAKLMADGEKPMEDLKIDELREIHRDLAQYLANQNELIITLRRTVATLQQTLDNDSAPQGGRSALADRYREYLASQETSETLRPNPTERLSREAMNFLVKKLTEW